MNKYYCPKRSIQKTMGAEIQCKTKFILSIDEFRFGNKADCRFFSLGRGHVAKFRLITL